MLGSAPLAKVARTNRADTKKPGAQARRLSTIGPRALDRYEHIKRRIEYTPAKRSIQDFFALR